MAPVVAAEHGLPEHAAANVPGVRPDVFGRTRDVIGCDEM